MKRTILLLCSISISSFAAAGTLTLEQAQMLARTYSPELRAARVEVLAAREEIQAAGRWANPELEFEAEGIGGDNDGFDQAEYSLGIAQEFALSGKNRKSKNIARHGEIMANEVLRQVEIDFDVEVRKAFIEVQALQEVEATQLSRIQLAEEFSKAAARRHEAGGASELDALQAEVQLAEVQLEYEAVANRLLGARKVLGGFIGAEVQELAGEFFQPVEPLNLVVVSESYPALLVLRALEEQNRSIALLEKSRRIPDVRVGMGVKVESDTNHQTYLIGASMPIPLFDSGRKESLATQMRADAVRAKQERLMRDLNLEVTRWQVEFSTAIAEVSRYESTLLPKAKRAYDLSLTGYESGRYSALELIVVQQSLSTIQIHYIEAQRDALIAQAELTRFIKEK